MLLALMSQRRGIVSIEYREAPRLGSVGLPRTTGIFQIADIAASSALATCLPPGSELPMNDSVRRSERYSQRQQHSRERTRNPNFTNTWIMSAGAMKTNTGAGAPNIDKRTRVPTR